PQYCVSIENLALPRRPFNALKRAGIHTIAQLLSLTEYELQNIRYFGVKNVSLVQSALREFLSVHPPQSVNMLVGPSNPTSFPPDALEPTEIDSWTLVQPSLLQEVVSVGVPLVHIPIARLGL